MPNNPAETKTRQLTNLHMIGFKDSDADLHTLITELEKFKTRYTEMITRYNAEATAAAESAIQPDQQALLGRSVIHKQCRGSVIKRLTW